MLLEGANFGDSSLGGVKTRRENRKKLSEAAGKEYNYTE